MYLKAPYILAILWQFCYFYVVSQISNDFISKWSKYEQLNQFATPYPCQFKQFKPKKPSRCEMGSLLFSVKVSGFFIEI